MPKFVLFLRDDDSAYPNMSPEQMQGIVQRYVAWRAKVQKDGRSIMGHKLRDHQGRVVKVTAGR